VHCGDNSHCVTSMRRAGTTPRKETLTSWVGVQTRRPARPYPWPPINPQVKGGVVSLISALNSKKRLRSWDFGAAGVSSFNDHLQLRCRWIA
jgi:hypothetical protein